MKIKKCWETRWTCVLASEIDPEIYSAATALTRFLGWSTLIPPADRQLVGKNLQRYDLKGR
jgi:hypothetical protein